MKDQMQKIINTSLELIKSKNYKGLINVYSEVNKTASFSLGKIDELTEGEKGSVGIKVMDSEGRVSTSVTNILTEEGILDATKKCCNLVDYSEPEEYNDISDDMENNFNNNAFDLETKDTPIEVIMEKAKNLEESIKSLDPRIKYVRKSSVSTNCSKLTFGNTNGVFKTREYTMATGQTSLSAVDGEESSMGFGFDIQRKIKDINIDKIAKDAVDYAVGGLNASIMKSGRYDVILSPFVAANLSSVLITPLSGENVCKGKSFFKDKIGEKVANENLSLLHDPMNLDFPIISPFDNEGTTTKKFYFIQDGILKTYANNIYSAKKLNEKPTGNGFASSDRPLPSVSCLNMYFEPNSNKEEIMNRNEALYITNAMGLHTVDPISGRFSIQISGRVVRDGKFKESFRGMTMAGTVQELLENILLVGDDFKSMGPVSGSTTFIKDMSVGGK